MGADLLALSSLRTRGPKRRLECQRTAALLYLKEVDTYTEKYVEHCTTSRVPGKKL